LLYFISDGCFLQVLNIKNDQNYYDYTKIFVGYIIARKNTMLENMAVFFLLFISPKTKFLVIAATKNTIP